MSVFTLPQADTIYMHTHMQVYRNMHMHTDKHDNTKTCTHKHVHTNTHACAHFPWFPECTFYSKASFGDLYIAALVLVTMLFSHILP